MIIVVVVVSFVGGAVTDVGGGEMRRESELRRERERKKGERERKRGREVDFADRRQFFILQERYPPHWLLAAVKRPT